jgi:hypothetical protein
VTTIRSAPTAFAQIPGQGAQRPAMDPDKLAAQRAIFAQLAGTAPAASPPVAAPAARAAEPAVMQQAAPTPRRLMDIPAEQPTRYLRPGSFVDIRV